MVTGISYTIFPGSSTPEFPARRGKPPAWQAYLVAWRGFLRKKNTFCWAPGKSDKKPPFFSSFCPLPLTGRELSITMGAPQREWNITGALGAFPAVMWRKSPPGPLGRIKSGTVRGLARKFFPWQGEKSQEYLGVFQDFSTRPGGKFAGKTGAGIGLMLPLT